MITVLEAQLLKEPRVDAKVVQSVRKGEHLYIHKKHFIKGPLESEYFKEHIPDLMEYEGNDEHPGFYLTRDNTGEDAYIPVDFVKLIYRDEREFTQAVTPFDPDPMDYRLPEPLPDGYPLIKEYSYRSMVSFFAGPDIKSNYPYAQVVDKEDFSYRGGFSANFMRRGNWDIEDRVYWGAVFQMWTSRTDYDLFDGTNSTENKGQIGFGPVLSYDTWKNENYAVNLSFQALLNYNRVIVERNDDSLNLSEERSFVGWSVSPKISTTFHLINLMSKGSFYIGADMQLMFPTTLSSNTLANAPDLWNDFGTNSDQIEYPFMAIWSGIAGVQFQY